MLENLAKKYNNTIIAPPNIEGIRTPILYTIDFDASVITSTSVKGA